MPLCLFMPAAHLAMFDIGRLRRDHCALALGRTARVQVGADDEGDALVLEALENAWWVAWMFSRPSGVSLRATSSYDGIADDDVSAYGGMLRVNLPLNRGARATVSGN